MGRDVKQIVTGGVWYTPDIDNNRDDPDPFEVFIHPLSAGDMKVVEAGMGHFTGAKINFTERAQAQIRSVFSKYVTEVHGYAIRHNKTGERIEPRNGVALYTVIMDHGDDDESKVIDDIYAALKSVSHLREGLRETLRSRSTSLPAAIALHGNGVASAVDARTQAVSSEETPKNGASETAMEKPTQILPVSPVLD